MLTDEKLAEIEGADLHSLQPDAQYNPDVWTLNKWREQLLAEVKQLREQLDQVAKVADQIESAAASDSRNREERIEAAIERDGVWSSRRDPGIAQVSMAIKIQTDIVKRLRRALTGGEGQC